MTKADIRLIKEALDKSVPVLVAEAFVTELVTLKAQEARGKLNDTERTLRARR